MKYAYHPSARIQRLRARALANDLSVRKHQGLRGLAFCGGYLAAEGQPLVVRRARGLASVMDRIPAAVMEDELLVGHHYLGDESLDFPEFYPWSEAREARLEGTLLTPQERARYKELVAELRGLAAQPSSVEPLPDLIREEQRRRIIEIWGVLFNHSVRGYDKLLRLGFDALCAEIEAQLEALPSPIPWPPASGPSGRQRAPSPRQGRGWERAMPRPPSASWLFAPTPLAAMSWRRSAMLVSKYPRARRAPSARRCRPSGLGT